MDSVSQALWGGLSSVASSRDTNVRQTFVWGAVGGTLPDLDAWIGALVGPVQERIWHRGPSHSLVLLGAVGALILWRHRSHATAVSSRLKHVWVRAFTHPFLDILTGFETGWGIPLVEPSALGWFPVIEPVLFGLLLMISIRCLVKRTRRGLAPGLALVLGWIGLVGLHHQWVIRGIERNASSILPGGDIIARPMLGSFMTYRVVWSDDERCAIAGYQPWKKHRQWSPAHVFERFEGSSTVDDALDLLLSRGCFGQLPDGSIGDLRFALTPDNPSPLWVWVLSEAGWTREARREMTETDRAHFKSLWLGHEQLDWTSEPVVIEGD